MTRCTSSTSPRWPRPGTLLLLVWIAAGCSSEAATPSAAPAMDAGNDARDATARDEESTGRPDAGSAAVDYEAAFPQDRVARLDVTIAPEAWTRMLDDMTEQLGKFGEGGFPGGMRGPAGGSETSANACDGLSAGDACLSDFFGMKGPGMCTDLFGTLICMPTGAMGGPGAAPPGGPAGGGSADLLDETPIYVECDVATSDRRWSHVGIRFKGNSSLAMSWQQGVYKLPLRLKFDAFEDMYPEVAKQRFYGFKNLSLSNGSNDPSLLREKLGNEVFLAAGFAAPASAFYRVYIDHGEGPVYFGLYTGIELPSDKAFLETHFGSDEGNLYKPDGTGATFASWVQDSFEKENHEDEADWSDVKAVFDALHAKREDAAAWRSGLERAFDVDTFLHWLALNTVIENWDAYGRMSHNFYLYADPQEGGKVQWIPWDQSFAFGGSMGFPGGAGPPGGAGALPPFPGAGFPGGGFPGGGFLAAPLDQSGVTAAWPLIRFLLDDPVYRARYRGFVTQVADAEYAVDTFEARFRAAHALIAPYVVGDEGEREGHSFLASEAAFYDALDELIAHVKKRKTDVATYLRRDD